MVFHNPENMIHVTDIEKCELDGFMVIKIDITEEIVENESQTLTNIKYKIAVNAIQNLGYELKFFFPNYQLVLTIHCHLTVVY